MNCENCGNVISENAKFCRSCGRKVTTEEAVTIENTGIEIKIQAEDLKKLKNQGVGFLQYMVDIIKNPVLDKQNLRNSLSQNQVLVFLPIMILINAFIVSLQVKVVQSSIVKASIGFLELGDILGGFNYIEPKGIIKQQFILTIVFFAILGLGMFLVYQLLMKIDITFIDTLRIALHTVIILNVSNGMAWILGLISLKLLAIAVAIVILLFTTMVAAQVFAYVGMKAKVIYTMPIIYLLSIYFTISLYIKVLS